jgi:hypothetical protein
MTTIDTDTDTAPTRNGPMPAAGWPCSECGTSGIDCLDLLNSRTPSRCCGWCPLIDGHGDTTAPAAS